MLVGFEIGVLSMWEGEGERERERDRGGYIERS
jgi:hypothetical protein